MLLPIDILDGQFAIENYHFFEAKCMNQRHHDCIEFFYSFQAPNHQV